MTATHLAQEITQFFKGLPEGMQVYVSRIEFGQYGQIVAVEFVPRKRP